jgi:hypothetical protein
VVALQITDLDRSNRDVNEYGPNSSVIVPSIFASEYRGYSEAPR